MAEPLARGRSIRWDAAETHVELALSSQATAGQVVATVDNILGTVPDALVIMSPDVSTEARTVLGADPRMSMSGPSDRDRRRCSAELTIHVPLLWDRELLGDLLARARAVDGRSTTVVDADAPSSPRSARRATPVGRVGPPAWARPRRSSPRSIPSDCLTATAAGVEVLHDEIDLAAHFAGWRRA